MSKSRQIIVKASLLHDGKAFSENKTVVIEDGLIADVTSKRVQADFEGIVTPAFIDPHSHIGMAREGEPSEEGEANDITWQIMPLCNPLNSVYFDDRAFSQAVDFGVLYSCIVPGSGNLLGGKAMVIRNFADNAPEALLKDYGYKMALGYNPRAGRDWKGERPNTRMGIYAVLEQRFDEVLIKEKKASLTKEKKLRDLQSKVNDKKIDTHEQKIEQEHIDAEYEVEFTPIEKEILSLLSGEKTIKCHVHKTDDALYLIHLVKKYKIKVTADHLGDVFTPETFRQLHDARIGIVYGPLGSFDYKVELKNGHYKNAKALMDSGVPFGLMSDHPVVCSYNLRDTLKFFLIHGMPADKALSLLTYQNAKLLGLEKTLGTIEKGKIASLLVWNTDPLHLSAMPTAVIGEGRLLLKR